jgi:signal transduction histidine kinase
MVYYDAPHAFSAEELRLAATIAQHVGMGLSRLASEDAINDLLRREQAARLEADRARAEAESANHAKDEFLAMLAHELRNPLAVIVNAVTLMEGDTVPPESRRAVAMIRRQAGHLAHLLDDLLDVARITSGHIELERERVDLRGAVAQALETQRPWLEGRRQAVTIAVADGPVEVVGDAVRLQQVLGNLLNNASKYTPAAGAIRIGLEVDGADAVLRVKDEGAGIPFEKLDAIFGLFVQANPSLARTEGGLGIGLTLVKRIVELHGGTVRALSEGPGRGAELVVRLPLAPPATVTAVLAPAPPKPRPKRILVIEDHDDGREALVANLRRGGHEVFQAATGQTGLDLAGRHQPDVVLVDIGLPDIEGYQVGRELRDRFGDRVRLVALTGYGQPRDRALSEQAGFDAHLVKPVEPPRLAEALERTS